MSPEDSLKACELYADFGFGAWSGFQFEIVITWHRDLESSSRIRRVVTMNLVTGK